MCVSVSFFTGSSKRDPLNELAARFARYFLSPVALKNPFGIQGDFILTSLIGQRCGILDYPLIFPAAFRSFIVIIKKKARVG